MTAKPNTRGGSRPGAGRKPREKPASEIKEINKIKPDGNQTIAKPSNRGGFRPGAGRKPKGKPAEFNSDGNQTTGRVYGWGGARPGAGRKPKPVPDVRSTAPIEERLEPQSTD